MHLKSRILFAPADRTQSAPQDMTEPKGQDEGDDQDQNGPQDVGGSGGESGGGQGDQDKPQDKDKPQKKSRKGLFILAAVIVFLLVGGGIYVFLTRNLESTDDAYTEGNAITMAPKVSGYIVELDINDNSYVKAGDILLKIDPRDYINARDQAQASLDLSVAQLRNAQLNYDIARVQIPARLVQAEAQKVQAVAQRFEAERQYRRQHSVDTRATTQENIDTATEQQEAANSQVAYNQAQVDVAKLIPQNLKAAKAQVDQLTAQVAQAQAQLNQAQLNLSYTEVHAPQSGKVTRRNVQLGTYLVAGQSMFELVTNDEWVVANFKETQLDRMRVCQHVSISVDAHPDIKLTGHIDTIQDGSGSRFSSFPAENATGNFVKIVQRVPVKIVLDKNDNLPIPIGLSVEPTIDLGSEKNCTQAERNQ